MAECHPDRPHWGKGQCKRCLQRAWFLEHGRKPKAALPPRRTLWPQAIVTVPNMPKGWGSIT
jgi:hypothetical protein